MHGKDTVPKIRNKYSQKWNCAALFPIPTFTYLWAIYIFPWSVRLFCSKTGGPTWAYIFFWRARVCRPLLRLCCPFMIFEGCLDSNPEYCRSKLARYRLSHPSLYVGIYKSFTDTWMWKMLTQFLFWKYINQIFIVVCKVTVKYTNKYCACQNLYRSNSDIFESWNL